MDLPIKICIRKREEFFMSENIFKGLFDSDTVSVIAVSDFYYV